MTIPFWCLVVVIFIPIILGFVGAKARTDEFGSADNKHPRSQAAKLEGRGARVYAAQENAWEAAIMFSVAVITTHLAGLDPASAAPFAIGFVVLRIVHAVTYIADQDKLRSVSFILGLVCMITLFVKAA
ncbi:MAG: MAPEG family protein [Myxococcota bacterium]|jgi:uncharacterized MAPEG superfamily protein